MKMKLGDFAEAISTRVWESVGQANWRKFDDARTFVRSLELKSNKEWRSYTKSKHCPSDIPANPSVIYKASGWKSFGDWLGTGRVSVWYKQYRTFLQARAFTHDLGLKSETEWRAYTKSGKKPNDIPANPNQTYAKDGWAGMGDWLGTGTIASRLREYRPFKEARDFARSLKLKSQTEWLDYTKSGKKPNDVPANPDRTYAEVGWVGMGDWLGTGTIASHLREYRSFKEARAFARSLKLKSGAEWLEYCRSGEKPADIPDHPRPKYSGAGWAGWADWLGYQRSGRRSEARFMKGTVEAPAPADASP
jgi:hypothetical protein